jgi:hypothetical protein
MTEVGIYEADHDADDSVEEGAGHSRDRQVSPVENSAYSTESKDPADLSVKTQEAENG